MTVLITACVDSDTSKPKDAPMTIGVPGFIQKFYTYGEGTVEAWLKCGEQQVMSLGIATEGQLVYGSCIFDSNLDTADITISFVFHSVQYNESLYIASSTKQYKKGIREIQFRDSDYVFDDANFNWDFDHDGISNMDELTALVRTSPVSGNWLISGTVTGLSNGSIQLVNNDDASDTLTISSTNIDKNFAFNNRMPEGTSYSVAITQVPSSLKCIPALSTGTATAPVIINISCSPYSYTIGVAVSGLLGTGLQLINKVNNDFVDVSGNGNSDFPMAVLRGDNYTVEVSTQPQNPQQICQVSSGTGTVTNNNIRLNVICIDNIAPAIASTSPANKASNVDPDSALVFTFTEDMDSSTLTTNHFSVTSNGDPVAGTLSSPSPNTLLFVPTQAMSLASSYSVTLDGNVADAQGNTMGANYSWQFSIRDGNWSAEASTAAFSTVTFTVYDNVLMLASGDSILRYNFSTHNWSAVDSAPVASYTGGILTKNGKYVMVKCANNSITALRYDNGWSAEATLSARPVASLNTIRCQDLQVTGNNIGNVIVIWPEVTVGGTMELYSNLYSAQGWDQYAQYITFSNDGLWPEIAMDDNSNAIMIWDMAGVGNGTNLLAQRFDSVLGWISPPEVATNTNSSRSFVFFRLQMDSSGTAFISWAMTDTPNDTYLNIYNSQFGGWGTQRLFDKTLKTDSRGNAMAVWSEGVATTLVNTEYYSATDNIWTTNVISTPSINVYSNLNYEFNNKGNAIAVWNETNSGVTTSFVNYFNAGSWAISPIEIANYGDIYDLLIDNSGNVTVVWSGAGGLTMSRRAFGKWGNTISLTNMVSPKFYLEDTGKITAVWQNNSQTYTQRFE